MKNILKLFIFTIPMIMITVSCTKGNDNFPVNQDLKNKVSEEINSYLEDKVSVYEIININNSNREYFFSEVKTNNGEGYLIADKKQQNIIAFIDFDFTNQTTTIYDYVKKEEVFTQNIEMYLNNDFNTFVNKINGSKQVSSKRFWGWSCGSAGNTTGSDCVRSCCYYILGIRNGCDVYDCNNLPGRNPKINK